MTRIIFVHGMNATSESWNTIPEKFNQAGFDAVSVDLPGHDRDLPLTVLLLGSKGTYSSGLTMNDYVEAVVAKFPAEDERNVVLVGHSMGGAVISQVAQQHPGRIKQLIYVAAMLPDTGDSPAKIINAIKDMDVPVTKTLGDYLPHLLKLRFVYQPEEPLGATFSRTPGFDAIPRGYVLCEEDDVIPAQLQETMLEAYGSASAKSDVVRLRRSHLPQYDRPDELFEKMKAMLSV
ncbi:alpha/beta fold hydrolase [Roseibium sp. HPY-6]|uniref:alpha/beta fold hydrolase n=1 Tax=Roseibium sp. HPY-6 TaxID=3229852 RepID=UPI00338F76AA